MPGTVADATNACSVDERLAARYEDLAPAERRVAEQLLALGPTALVQSAAALGRELGTSDATIVRTAKALGYGSLRELREQLAVDTAAAAPDARLRRALRQVDPHDVLGGFAAEQSANVGALARNVTPQDFEHAIDLLSSADRVVWRGVGPSAALAEYGALLMTRIGVASASFVQSGTSFADELLSLRSGDVIVLLAYGALQAHVIALVERAADIATPIVLMTDTLGRRLSKRVAVTLHSGRGAPGEFASHASTLVLVEALTLGLAGRDRVAADAALRRLNDLRAAITGRRVDVDVPR